MRPLAQFLNRQICFKNFVMHGNSDKLTSVPIYYIHINSPVSKFLSDLLYNKTICLYTNLIKISLIYSSI